jgi:tripartite-type tricarboxylate transporter receptor subunit TctC
MTEGDYPETNVVPWYGLVVPSGVPQPVVDKIVAGVSEALKYANVRSLLEKQALQPVEPMAPQQIADLIASDTARYAKVIQEANIRVTE